MFLHIYVAIVAVAVDGVRNRCSGITCRWEAVENYSTEAR